MSAPLFAGHPGGHCRPPSRITLFFRAALRRVTRKPAAPGTVAEQDARVPADATPGAAAPRFPCCEHCVSSGLSLCDPPDSHRVACSDGCNAPVPAHPVPVHPVTDPAGIPVLGDRMLSEVREQYAPAPWRPVPVFTPAPPGPITAHANAIQAMSARFLPAPETIGGYPVTYHRPVNGRNLGMQPRRRVYGEAPQLAVDRTEYLAEEAAEADRAAYVRSQMRDGMAARDPETLRQVLTGLRKL